MEVTEGNVTVAVPEQAEAGVGDEVFFNPVQELNRDLTVLQWGTDPNDASTSQIDVTVEADFKEGLPNDRLNNSVWESGIEQNYKLYGISLDIQRDDTISSTVKQKVFDEDTDLNLYVISRLTNPLPTNSDTWGINIEASAASVAGFPSKGHLLYAEKIEQSAGGLVTDSDVRDSPYNTRTELLGAFIEMHELGHSFRLGRSDDLAVPLPPGEVYSGLETPGLLSKPNDGTPERVRINGNPTLEWSVMRFGWDDNSLFEHDGATYFVFSIEELTTIENPGS